MKNTKQNAQKYIRDCGIFGRSDFNYNDVIKIMVQWGNELAKSSQSSQKSKNDLSPDVIASFCPSCNCKNIMWHQPSRCNYCPECKKYWN